MIFLTWSEKCIIVTGDYCDNPDNKPKFEITDTKRYVAVVTLSTQDNEKLLQRLKTGFERITNWNNYQSEPKIYTQNRYLKHLIDPSFQGVNRLFVLSFEDDEHRSYKRYFLPTVEIKDYSVMIGGQNFFDQPVKNDLITYENIGTVRRFNYTTGCLLDYDYFKKYFKMIAIDLLSSA